VKKILLTGINGQVGHALHHKLNAFDLIALTRTQLDLTRLDDIRRVVRDIKPDLIINPAGYTAVDKA
jgi:dTDP-4-dehydrorhamnose reductase